MPKPPPTPPTGEDAQNAVRTALAELLIAIDPLTAGRTAITLIRLAAALVALAEARAQDGPRGAACELLLMLAEGPPALPAAADLQAAA